MNLVMGMCVSLIENEHHYPAGDSWRRQMFRQDGLLPATSA
ncbi:MAG: hypothetical protein R3E89_00865 [Thiolinea sp.]